MSLVRVRGGPQLVGVARETRPSLPSAPEQAVESVVGSGSPLKGPLPMGYVHSDV